MTPGLILADDLTGAAEVAAFAGTAQRPARVTWAAGAPLEAGEATAVVDTETRNASDEVARRRLRDLLGTALGEGAPVAGEPSVFKKIDSTLRGPVRAEIEVLGERLGGVPVVAATAYPRMDRVTRAGVQMLNGVPVADGPAGDDPLAPARSSEVCRVLPRGACEVVASPTGRTGPEALAAEVRGHLREGRHVVLDAEQESDLETIAEAIRRLRPPLLVGSGGLARHLWPHRHPVEPEVADGPVLVVVGSNHPAARVQVGRLRRTWTTHAFGGACPVEPLPEHPVEVLVLATPDTRADPSVALRDLGDAMEEVMALVRPGAMFVTGGETALHVLGRMDARALDVVGELVPGIPVARIVGGPFAGATLATKAGGFGQPELLERVVARLRPSTRSTVRSPRP